MARRPRVEFSGAFYHIITRGNRKQPVFLDDKDYRYYLNTLLHYKRRYRFLLYGYILMSNHIHLLLETKDIPLSKIMQCIQLKYTLYFNKKYKQSGHLFQGRYKAILCDKDEYLLMLIKYIHNNPIKAGIVKVHDKYIWSSHQEYLGNKLIKEPLITTGRILNYFSPLHGVALKKYSEFISKQDVEIQGRKYYNEKDTRFFGDEEFLEQVRKAKLVDTSEKTYKKTLRSREADKVLTNLASEVCREFGVKKSDIFSQGRGRIGATVRYIISYLAYERFGVGLKEIASFFSRQIPTISYGINLMKEEIKTHNDISSKIEDLTNQLKIPQD